MDTHSATCESRKGAREVGLLPWSPTRYHHPQACDHLDDTDWPKLGTDPARGKEGPHRKLRPVAAVGNAQASGPPESPQANGPPPKTTHCEVICTAAGARETRAPTERGASATRRLHRPTEMRGIPGEVTPGRAQTRPWPPGNPSTPRFLDPSRQPTTRTLTPSQDGPRIPALGGRRSASPGVGKGCQLDPPPRRSRESAPTPPGMPRRMKPELNPAQGKGITPGEGNGDSGAPAPRGHSRHPSPQPTPRGGEAYS